MQKVVRIGTRIVLSIFAILALLALGAGWVWLSTEQEEVASQSGDITIRGTLLSPRFGREAPGVVLVHGSGQTSRNSTMLYAWIFASQGYAALAYDKRGVGRSEGGSNEWDEFSVGDLASDAAAGYRYLQSLIEVDPERVGFFGASQGAWVVSLAANRVDPPAFLVMVSASVSTIAEDRRVTRGQDRGVCRCRGGEAGKGAKAQNHVPGQGAKQGEACKRYHRDTLWARESQGPD